MTAKLKFAAWIALSAALIAALACGDDNAEQTAADGEAAFSANCAACHGPGGTGTNSGPPLVHKIYEPGHHPDFAFRNAVRNGVRSHHWNFGDMQPVSGVSDDELESIIAYVRDVQRQAGIFQ